MSQAVFRERESKSEKMKGNQQVTCPKCCSGMKRKRAPSHHCVRNGDVVLVDGSLVLVDAS